MSSSTITRLLNSTYGTVSKNGPVRGKPFAESPHLEKTGHASGNGTSALTEALLLNEWGYAVVPCNGKRATISGWNQRRLTAAELRNALANPNLNIAIELNQSNLIDVECDTEEAETAVLALFGGHVPPTPTWQSKRGYHRLFRRPVGLPEKAMLKIDGIEFRIGNGKGALSVVPPSVHPDGARYAWIPGLSIHEVEPAELPSSIIGRLLAPAAPARNSKASPDGVILEPGRNDELFRQACNLFREGHPATYVIAMVSGLNWTYCQPPLEEKEVAQLVVSAESQVNNAREKTYPYSIQQGRTVVECTSNDTTTYKPLCNFSAQIVEEITTDDGVEQRKMFVLAGQIANGAILPRVEVPATEFASMAWVLPNWGTAAVIYAGMSAKDQLRAAIQLMSVDVRQRTVFAHTGWREVAGRWVYLHASGAIGAEGTVPTVHVSLPPSLSLFRLPEPPTDQGVKEAISASLQILDLAPEPITASILGAVYRSVLASADFCVHLAGPTGQGKTELAALCQQHFGAGMDARHLPASWSSTANSNEALASHAKDALLVVDDFAPCGTQSDVARMHRDGDRLFRAQGNQSGRGRCRTDGSLLPAKAPRGLILSTGEDIPKGQSLRARQWVLELAPGDLKWDRLTSSQSDGRTGNLAGAIAAYVQWLAQRIIDIWRELPERVAQIRDSLRLTGQHARTPGIAADLLLGWEAFLEFAVDVGAITIVRRQNTISRVRKALCAAAGRQSAHVESGEPASYFLRLLAAALTSGRAHVCDPKGQAPNSPGLWGWHTDPRDNLLRPRGNKIGWLDGNDLYLEPDASHAAAQELAREQGETLGVTAQTLRKRLQERGLLASTEIGKLTNRRTLEGGERSVVHLLAASLFPPKPGE